MQLWQPGQELQNGKFTIQKYLGGGGYGETYRAIDTNTNKTVAIKILNETRRSKPNFEQQQVKFVKEAFCLKGCSHPNIVKVHELINENGLWGMVMEYIQGQDLSVYIKQKGKLSEVEALKYINQVGTALEHVHQKGMLHRDVKPHNIILRQSQQEVVLIDFGLAREFDLNKTGSMTSDKTHGYAPIEQYERHGKFGPYTDVYALAATLYALVTGEKPFESEFRKYAELPPPKQLNPDISDRVNDGIIKGMAFKPQDRTQTVREWLELVMPSQVKFSTPQNQSSKTYQLKPSQVFPTPQQKPSQASQNNISGYAKLIASLRAIVKQFQSVAIASFNFVLLAMRNIQLILLKYLPVKIRTRKFKFEYAKIDENLKITKYRGETKGFIENLGNGVTLEMVAIPGGSFSMGARKYEKGARTGEIPLHKVNLNPFFMGKYQITNEQYEAIVGYNPSYFKGENRPVNEVSWWFAVFFCESLSRRTGRQYRLPSEAEWEYACRAGTTTPFHFGKTITTDLSNYRGTDNKEFEKLGSYGRGPKGVYRDETTPVGSFPANSFGLYDMHGNIMELCLDDWHDNYQGAPTDGRAWFDDTKDLSLKTGSAIARGGSYFCNPEFCRSADRAAFDRSERRASINVGFRVVCAVGRTK